MTTPKVVQVVKPLSQMIGICHLLGMKLKEQPAVNATAWDHMCRRLAANITYFMITAGMLHVG